MTPLDLHNNGDCWFWCVFCAYEDAQTERENDDE